MPMRSIDQFVAGRPLAGHSCGAESGPSKVMIDPASGQPLASVELEPMRAVEAAVQAARDAFPAWSGLPVGDRCQVLFRFKHRLEEAFEELAGLIVREHGKTLAEARGDVRRGIDCVEFACGAPTLLMGRSLPQIAVSSSFSRESDGAGAGIDSLIDRVPLGVCVGITPFNFPVMVPLWMWPIAVAAGNTFVLKPSEKVPMSALRQVELAHEAGLPAGVLNLVTGGARVVEALIDHEEVRAISFVGSTKVARQVYQRAAAAGKRAQCMGGAKNAVVIMPDANRAAAIEGVLGSAFGNSGQRCLAGSVSVVVGDAAEWFVSGIVDAAKGMRVGPGGAAGVSMGPVIDEASRRRIIGCIESGVAEGASLILDGRQASLPSVGCFIGPTIFDHARPGMQVLEEEIFGPVLTIVREPTLDAAIATINRSSYGNMGAIFTSSGHSARRFRAMAQVGMVGINVGVPAPMAVFPFAGWKRSFFGDLHANGEDAVRFWTELQVVVSRWGL